MYKYSLPVWGTGLCSGSGSVTKGNVDGLVVTVLSNRILFIDRMKSRDISWVSVSAKPSNLSEKRHDINDQFMHTHTHTYTHIHVHVHTHQSWSV